MWLPALHPFVPVRPCRGNPRRETIASFFRRSPDRRQLAPAGLYVLRRRRSLVSSRRGGVPHRRSRVLVSVPCLGACARTLCTRTPPSQPTRLRCDRAGARFFVVKQLARCGSERVVVNAFRLFCRVGHSLRFTALLPLYGPGMDKCDQLLNVECYAWLVHRTFMHFLT